jgi:hypothetical protein
MYSPLNPHADEVAQTTVVEPKIKWLQEVLPSANCFSWFGFALIHHNNTELFPKAQRIRWIYRYFILCLYISILDGLEVGQRSQAHYIKMTHTDQ